MITLVRIIVGFLLALFTTSCAFDINLDGGKKGNGNVVQEDRNISNGFTHVSASEGLDVYVSQGKTLKIEVEADDNVIDFIKTDIRAGELKVHTTQSIGRATKNIYVTMPVIEGLRSSSGADIFGKEVLSCDHLELDASSGSDIQIEVMAQAIDIDTSSGADVRISGTTETLTADASSGSGIRAKKLETKTCIADASSGADITVNVSDNLNADASSGADITYLGEATVQKNKSVSGSVRKL